MVHIARPSNRATSPPNDERPLGVADRNHGTGAARVIGLGFRRARRRAAAHKSKRDDKRDNPHTPITAMSASRFRLAYVKRSCCRSSSPLYQGAEISAVCDAATRIGMRRGAEGVANVQPAATRVEGDGLRRGSDDLQPPHRIVTVALSERTEPTEKAPHRGRLLNSARRRGALLSYSLHPQPRCAHARPRSPSPSAPEDGTVVLYAAGLSSDPARTPYRWT